MSSLWRVQDVAERCRFAHVMCCKSAQRPILAFTPGSTCWPLHVCQMMPPLMFKEQEIEALVLGARMVETWADKELAEAATDAIAKIEAIIPEALRTYMSNTALFAPDNHCMVPLAIDLAELRRAVRTRLKIHFRYKDVLQQSTERTARPLSLAFFGSVWILGAWCELREDFRTFRLDRIESYEVTADSFRNEHGKSLQDFLKRPETWCQNAQTAELGGMPSRSAA